MDIGSRMKSLRLQRGLTQEELASRCELTKGYISQLENDIASPSIATLIDILNVLGTTPQSFFTEKNQKEKIVFTKKDFFESDCGDGKTIWLIPNSQKNEMEPTILILPPDGESYIRYPFEGEEFGYVLEGKIEIITADGVSQQAKKGDAFYIDGGNEHKIKNSGGANAKIIWVATPSNF
ncbi:MAG: helix-turn-helix domain-containing protein [Clostridia bacterium]|nr:helix-turn-helix domain-containing protein [Clostridia bacterium]